MRHIDDEKVNDLREKMLKVTYDNAYNVALGIEVLELNPNYGKGRMKYRPEVLNPYGDFHGGALLSFADTIAGTTACMNGYYVSTITSHMNFLLAGKNTEYIYCEAMKLKTGKHILVYDIRITDDKGNIIDSGEYSFFVSKKKVLED